MTFKPTMSALAFFLWSLLSTGCSSGPQVQTLILDNGHKYPVLGAGIIQSPLVGGKPAFVLAYISRFPLSDPSKMQSEISDLEIFLVLNAEKQHLNFALLEIHDLPPKALGINKNIGYVYERDRQGNWHHKGDSAVIPMAFPTTPARGA